MATVFLVRRCKLAEVTPDECRADGFESLEALHADLLRFYPKMTMESEVTVIRWKDVEGAFVDQHRRLQELRQAERRLHPPGLH